MGSAFIALLLQYCCVLYYPILNFLKFNNVNPLKNIFQNLGIV
jgi:hypothetical protein